MILSLLLGIIRTDCIPRLWVTENSTRKHPDVLFSSSINFSWSSFPTIFTSLDSWTTSSPPLTFVRTANSSELRRLRVVWLAVPLDTLGELICISVRGCTKYYTHEYILNVWHANFCSYPPLCLDLQNVRVPHTALDELGSQFLLEWWQGSFMCAQ